MNTIASELESLSFGAPQLHGHLTVFPLLHPSPRVPFYLTLDEALAQGTIQVTEVSKGGHVPELLLVNRGDRPVLLIDGEELVGAKQNRVLNLTLLAPAHSDLVIPVSCVERGRWNSVSATFAAAPRVQFSASRAAKVASVSQCLASEGRAVSNQGAVWEEIASKTRRMGVDSETGAMADLFEHAGEQLERYVRAFSPLPGQTGAVFALGGKAVGLELFFSPDTLTKLLPKLVRSYALDAIEIPGTDSPPAPPDGAASFLRQVTTAQVQRFPGIGAGETLRLAAFGLAGVGLHAEGALLHLAAFRTDRNAGETPQGPRSNMRRASQRFGF